MPLPQNALIWILRAEGGYVNNPADPGGETNHGITAATLREARISGLVKTQSVKDLTNEDVRVIYEVRYWNPSMCDSLPSTIALIHFDCAVNAGVQQAAKSLQKAVNNVSAVRKVQVSGKMSPELCGVVRSLPADMMNKSYLDTRVAFYKSLNTFHIFGKGWINRLSNLAHYLNIAWSPENK